MERLTTLAFFVLSACYNPTFHDGQYLCRNDGDCAFIGSEWSCNACGECVERTSPRLFACGDGGADLPPPLGNVDQLGPSPDASACETCASGRSCCDALSIPGGTFNRSNDPRYPATVSPFFLDRYEVTVGRFRAFVDAGYGTQEHAPTPGSGISRAGAVGWNAGWTALLPKDTPTLRAALNCDRRATWTGAPSENDRLPMSCVTWYEAFAFCIWNGGRLPTETEWNYAAAAGSEQREYPWGDDVPSASRAVYSTSSVAPVGTHVSGNGRWDQSDMAGNVWEWTFDSWDAVTSYSVPCYDCVSGTDGPSRTLRGGSFGSGAGTLSSVGRSNFPAATRSAEIGVRCVR